MAKSDKIKVTQISSSLRREKSQGLSLKALGLGKMHKTVEVVDTLQARGLIQKVSHLVKVGS